VLDKAVKLVNFVKARRLNNRLLSLLFDEMGIGYAQLYFILKFAGFPGAKY
jgi:hypothetical protein